MLAADGTPNVEIAALIGVSRPTVNLWRNRYAESGVSGLQDEPKPGRPRTVDRKTILTATLTPPPKRLGVTHWSSRLLADELKVAQNTVLRTWRHYRVQPWRSETFKFSTDPELVAKVTDVVGLYLAPPENAIVLCVDESGRAGARHRSSGTARFPSPPSEPGVRVSTHRALHGLMPVSASIMLRSSPMVSGCSQRGSGNG